MSVQQLCSQPAAAAHTLQTAENLFKRTREQVHRTPPKIALNSPLLLHPGCLLHTHSPDVLFLQIRPLSSPLHELRIAFFLRITYIHFCCLKTYLDRLEQRSRFEPAARVEAGCIRCERGYVAFGFPFQTSHVHFSLFSSDFFKRYGVLRLCIAARRTQLHSSAKHVSRFLGLRRAHTRRRMYNSSTRIKR